MSRLCSITGQNRKCRTGKERPVRMMKLLSGASEGRNGEEFFGKEDKDI